MSKRVHNSKESKFNKVLTRDQYSNKTRGAFGKEKNSYGAYDWNSGMVVKKINGRIVSWHTPHRRMRSVNK